MIQVREIHKSFGKVHAVRGVSFELKPGQVTALLGPNGAGKTTTIRMMTGYLPPDSGQVLIGPYDTVEQSLIARRSIGYLPESTPLYPEMKTRDYLDYRAKLFQIPTRARKDAVKQALERCWLTDVASRRIGHLSKGYKQRVGLAGALVHDPEVLILDEPTNGLDPSQIKETRSLIRELAQKRTLVISSHILPEIERLCDRVLVMARGTLRADGSPAALVAAARQTATYVIQARRSRPGDDEKAFQAFASIPYVGDIQPNTGDRSTQVTGWSLWFITAKPGAPDLREAIATVAMQGGILIRELRQEIPTLERVFLRLIETADEADAAGAAGGGEVEDKPGGSVALGGDGKG